MGDQRPSPSENQAPRPNQAPKPYTREDHREHYANIVYLRSMLHDITAVFGVVEMSYYEGDQVKVGAFATVRMSPQLAKALLIDLALNIRSYEARFGPIITSEETKAAAFELDNPASQKPQ